MSNEITDGLNAKSVLDNGAFTDAVQEVREDIMKLWEDSPFDDIQGRENCHKELHALKAVITRLKTKVDAGRLKQAEK